MRAIFQTLFNEQNMQAVVRGPNQYREYVVRFYIGEALQPECDYFTEDHADACNTAIAGVHGLKALEAFITQSWRN